MANLSPRQATTSPTWWLFVRFEQGRGRTGVPKTFVPYLTNQEGYPSVATLTKQAVQLLRAACADPGFHGKDLMPGSDDEYHLHNIDGGLVEKTDDLRWEKLDDTRQFSEVMLTWRIPNEHPGWLGV